jgi:hemerythrin-like domain-containing protein
MAAKNNPPSLAQDLLRIHRVISRALIVTVNRGDEFMQAGFPYLGLRKGFADYAKSLTLVLGAHHLGEDEIAFPFLREKIPAAPYERLARNHQEIEALLPSVRQAVAPVEEDGDEAGLTRLVEGLRKISSIWRPHIQAEEGHFSEQALAAAVDPDDQGQVSAAMARHAQEHATPGYLAIPFVLYNLETEDRVAMAASMPAMIVEELVPKAWKELWAPMRPFLLE